MKKLAILCVLACALVACEKPTNEESAEKQFTAAVQKDLEILNGTFQYIDGWGFDGTAHKSTITFVPFSQPISKTGSQSGNILDVYGTYWMDNSMVCYFGITKPTSDSQKGEGFTVHIMEADTDYYDDENYSKWNFYYTIIDKDTIEMVSMYPQSYPDKIPTIYTRL